MREQVHDAMVQVRVPAPLMAEAEQLAKRRHMSKSEFIRHAIRREVLEAA